MIERWLDLPGYEGRYSVSDHGNVRANRLGATPLAGSVDRYGYRRVTINTDRKPKSHRVHRLVCLAFHGAPPTQTHEVGHLDGVKLNNAASNLAWVTRSQNELHKFDHGTRVRKLRPESLGTQSMPGETNPLARLSNTQASEIRRRGLEGESCRLLAREFGVSKATTNKIIRGISYQAASSAETPNPYDD